MHIDYLDQHREHVATLAAWHHAEWGHLYDEWTLALAHAELADQATRRTLPTSLVLLDEGRPIGSVSLVLEDAPELCEEGSPWLASLFVLPEFRGRGLGAKLVHAAVEVAAREKVEHLFLFTPEHAGFYERLGWRLIARTALKGTAVDLMEIEPMACAGRHSLPASGQAPASLEDAA